MSEGMVDGYPRQLWWNTDGETIVESYTITDMAHGTPLGTADNDERYGAQGAFLIEAGISSSYHIASFFGLTEWIHRPKEVEGQSDKEAARPAAQLAKEAGKRIPVAPAVPMPVTDLAKVLWPLTTLHQQPEPPRQPQAPRRRAIDVGSVITRALTAAGLMKYGPHRCSTAGRRRADAILFRGGEENIAGAAKAAGLPGSRRAVYSAPPIGAEPGD